MGFGWKGSPSLGTMAIQIRDCIHRVSVAVLGYGVLWTHLEYPKVLLCEIPKIDPLIRFEVECELATIPKPLVSAQVSCKTTK
jgi:hypothetical protein